MLHGGPIYAPDINELKTTPALERAVLRWNCPEARVPPFAEVEEVLPEPVN